MLDLLFRSVVLLELNAVVSQRMDRVLNKAVSRRVLHDPVKGQVITILVSFEFLKQLFYFFVDLRIGVLANRLVGAQIYDYIGKVALQSVDAAFLVGRELEVEFWNSDLTMFGANDGAA